MQLSGFTHAPISKYFLLYIVISALVITATDIKHYFYLHLGLRSSTQHAPQWQWWRLLSWTMAYTNSTEVLFAAVTVYQLRVVERIWGSRKVLSFILTTLPYTTLLTPLVLFTLRFLTFSTTFSFLPSGPTALIFALLAQYHAAIPYSYRYRVATSSSTPNSSTASAQQQAQGSHNENSNASSLSHETKGIELTSKSASYLPALQLALSQLPGSLVPAAVGWAVGYAWRLDLLPWPGNRWRVPGWIVKDAVDRGVTGGASSASGRTRDREGEVGEVSGVGVGGSVGEGRRRAGGVV